MSSLFAFTFWSSALQRITAVSDALYEFCNRLLGRSWLFDNFLALSLDNQLVKAALLGGCFLAAWHAKEDEATVPRARRILLVTLLALAFVMATTQTLSKTVLLPRPFIRSQKAFHLEGNQLVESHRVAYRVPLDVDNQKAYQSLLKGDAIPNDLGSFPSDHAGFYVTLAVGIWLASRALGWLALSWTLIVVLGSRLVSGHHSPLDIVAGAGIGVVILLLFQLAFAKWLRPLIEPIVNWTLRHQAFATMLVFIGVFEVTDTLRNVRPLLKTGLAIVRHFSKG